MRKPCKEEITDLRIEINKLSFLLVILFTLSAECQVPINGFCKFNSFPIEKGMTTLFSLNLNNDAYSDLVVYSPSKPKLNVLIGDQSGAFLPYHSTGIKFEPTLIQNILDRNKHITGYAFTSRKKSKAGLLTFSSIGGVQIKNVISFASYPDNISASDVNGNNEPELLVSGGAFEGLSIISLKKNKLLDNKIAKGVNYSHSAFSDINHDKVADIIAFNLSVLKLDLFYNTGTGDFRKLRSISIDNKIKSLKLFDMNLDSFEDIIISYDRNISIYSGNFNSDFTLSKNLFTYYSPDKIIAADLNKDGRIDIAYIDTTEGVFSVIFSSGKSSFYDEIVYLKREGIKDIIPFYSKFINGAALADVNGFVYTVTNMQSVSGESDLLPALDPAILNSFISDNYDSIKDICFFDKGDKKLKLLIRNGSGIPNVYREISLDYDYNNLLTQYLGETSNFIFFNKWSSLLAGVKINFKTGFKTRNYFYADGKILDVRVSEKTKQIFVFSYDNERIFFTILNENFQKREVYNYNSGTGITDGNIITGKNLSLYFWQNKGDSLTLYNAYITNKFEHPVPKNNLLREYDKGIARDYFVNKMILRNYHIVSMNKEKKCISIKQAL